jgi:hypothetical protein
MHITTQSQQPRLAHTVDDLVRGGLGSRQSVYQLIKDGRLIARKRGRSTIILDDDLQACLRSLPTLGGGRAV